jgi:phytanoyl-CoA hydroxylase
MTAAPPEVSSPPSKPSRIVETGGFAGTRKGTFPAKRPPGYFSPDADPAAIGAFFQANGYLVMEDAFSPAEVAELKKETTLICRGGRGALEGVDLPPAGATDEQVLNHFLCVHFPHKISPAMRATLFNPPTLKALTSVIGPNVKFMQSMLFIKASGKPGQAWHQDEDYIMTRDRSLLGSWIGLDRATQENGCLWVIPGSHRPGILWEQRWHGDRRFDCAEESVGFPYTDEDAIPVEVEAGSVVFFQGYLLHRSLPNRAPAGTYRRALVNHYMSCESLLPWHKPAENEPMAKVDYRDIIVVAGVDPYAYRGTKDIARPVVRPAGDGGCASWSSKDLKYKDDPE